jgi:metallophosphoesterase (TIGR00282 family)
VPRIKNQFSGVERRKNLKILVIGDVTSPKGLEHLKKNLWNFRKTNGIDFCVVNGENASFVTGISPEGAVELLRAGADCITGGNHTMQNKAAYTYLDETAEILRPINFGDSAPGRGYTILDANGYRILVISAMGNVHIEPVLDNPFGFIDRVLREERGNYDFSILDIHAEATGEKLAVGYGYDGKINIVFGTHTHVKTADLQILPRGTGYITDVGMCGESGGVIGMDAECVVERMRTRLPKKFTPASGAPIADGAIFTLNESDGKVTAVQSVKF